MSAVCVLRSTPSSSRSRSCSLGAPLFLFLGLSQRLPQSLAPMPISPAPPHPVCALLLACQKTFPRGPPSLPSLSPPKAPLTISASVLRSLTLPVGDPVLTGGLWKRAHVLLAG